MVTQRQLPAQGSLPLNHAISKPVGSSVSPATTPTGVIKRPRVGSFNENKLATSPVDLTQRSTALRKATFMQFVRKKEETEASCRTAPTTNKVKVAVTPPVEIHGQAMPAIPNSKPIYPQAVTVTVNRNQVKFLLRNTRQIL